MLIEEAMGDVHVAQMIKTPISIRMATPMRVGRDGHSRGWAARALMAAHFATCASTAARANATRLVSSSTVPVPRSASGRPGVTRPHAPARPPAPYPAAIAPDAADGKRRPHLIGADDGDEAVSA